MARVNPSAMPVYTIVTANGKPAVLLNVFRQPEGNTVSVADATQRELSDPQDTACGRQPSDFLRPICAGA